MKQFRTFAIVAFCAVAALASCKKVEPDSLTVKQTEIVAEVDGGSYTVSFTTNKSWTAESNQAWVVLSKTSGEAGTYDVTVTVEPNGTYENREAMIHVASGALSGDVKVTQAYTQVFEVQGGDIELTPEAQEFAIKVTANVEYQVTPSVDWIQAVTTKAAPEEKTLKFAVTANDGLQAREGEILIGDGGAFNMKVTVSQAAVEGLMLPTSVKYLGTAMEPYDTENWCPTSFKEYALSFDTAEGQLVLAINVADKEDLAGEYLVDDAGTHAENTFSIKPLNVVKYYTTIINGENEIAVADGIVTIEAVDGGYAIVAQLADEQENIYTYSYTGALPEVEDASTGAFVSASYYADYFTHFTSKARQFSTSIYFTNGANGLYYLSLSLYADAAASPEALPLGKYTFAESYLVDENVKYSNGNYAYTAGQFTGGYAYANYDAEAGSYDNLDINDGEIEISEGSTPGTYKIALKVKVTPYSYDSDWNTVYGDPYVHEAVYDDVAAEITDNHLDPVEDGDAVFKTMPLSNKYSGYYFGDAYQDGGSVFYAGWQNVDSNWNVYLTFQTAEPYTYEKNFSGRFCNTPIPAATYTYNAETPKDAEGKAMNVLCNVVTASFRSITNTYTGTVFKVSGGSVTLTDNSIQINLTATYGENQEAHFTGTLDTECYYFRDYSANATWLGRVKWVE